MHTWSVRLSNNATTYVHASTERVARDLVLKGRPAGTKIQRITKIK